MAIIIFDREGMLRSICDTFILRLTAKNWSVPSTFYQDWYDSADVLRNFCSSLWLLSWNKKTQ